MIDLQRFCANETDPREHLRAPWRDGQWTYATNGHVCVRVHASVTGPAPVDRIVGKHPDTAALFAKWIDDRPGEFLVMPTLPAVQACRYCDGRGWHHAAKCPDCIDGEFKHGDHIYECQNCADEPVAAGWIDTGKQSDPQKPCEHCIGRGFEMADFEIGDQNWELGYLAWLAELPQLRVRTHYEPTEDGDPLKDAAAFVFDGGQALLMPKRREGL